MLTCLAYLFYPISKLIASKNNNPVNFLEFVFFFIFFFYGMSKPSSSWKPAPCPFIKITFHWPFDHCFGRSRLQSNNKSSQMRLAGKHKSSLHQPIEKHCCLLSSLWQPFQASEPQAAWIPDHARAGACLWRLQGWSWFPWQPKHLMCTEVRAASLSGECMLKNNKLGVLLEKFTGFHEHCVKKSAIRSFMAMHPACGKEVALDVFNRVFHSCYNDFTPFDRVVLTDRQAKLAYRAYMTQYRYKL